MYHVGRSTAALAATLLLLGCDTPPASRPDAEGEQAGTQPPSRPAVIDTTIPLEGTEEPVRLSLYRAPSGFPLPFSTYLPPDIRAEPEPADSGSGIRFTAAFAGTPRRDAYLYVYVYPADTPLGRASTLLRAFITGRGVPGAAGPGATVVFPDPNPGAPDPFAWSLEDFRFQVPGDTYIFGSAGLGTHSGRIFHVIVQYPEGWEEGFVPRADRILAAWRWEDTGAMLESTPAT